MYSQSVYFEEGPLLSPSWQVSHPQYTSTHSLLTPPLSLPLTSSSSYTFLPLIFSSCLFVLHFMHKTNVHQCISHWLINKKLSDHHKIQKPDLATPKKPHNHSVPRIIITELISKTSLVHCLGYLPISKVLMQNRGTGGRTWGDGLLNEHLAKQILQ